LVVARGRSFECENAISVEHFVPERDAFARDDERDAHLFAVRPVVSAVPALRHRIAERLPLEVRAGHVVEEQVVRDRKQLAESLLEVHLKRTLVWQEMIECAVQAVIVDAIGTHAEQVVERRLPIPILRDVQLTRWFA
jgi:hypothetical protein